MKALKSVGMRSEISATALKNNLTNFLEALHDTFDGIPNALAGYHLEEMEIEVEVSTEGEGGLLGTGGKVGGKGSLTFKLKRDIAAT
ncbi:hypothetical protein [Bradyrhizobium sp. Arg816]|uniref:Pepco domain-containing protein n=1 Tax=Bradyrhizobium sp. Arg816 TaxID=2998491 RepID=UPI00249E821F|nr:hypothetical protein [Bradyrhizobium sp. Arg816]MDI3561838.1 hypothetical protein [Bradyrhizobium sp. Arg816]